MLADTVTIQARTSLNADDNGCLSLCFQGAELFPLRFLSVRCERVAIDIRFCARLIQCTSHNCYAPVLMK